MIRRFGPLAVVVSALLSAPSSFAQETPSPVLTPTPAPPSATLTDAPSPTVATPSPIATTPAPAAASPTTPAPVAPDNCYGTDSACAAESLPFAYLSLVAIGACIKVDTSCAVNGDVGCNFASLGQTCRSCFLDCTAAKHFLDSDGGLTVNGLVMCYHDPLNTLGTNDYSYCGNCVTAGMLADSRCDNFSPRPTPAPAPAGSPTPPTPSPTAPPTAASAVALRVGVMSFPSDASARRRARRGRRALRRVNYSGDNLASTVAAAADGNEGGISHRRLTVGSLDLVRAMSAFFAVNTTNVYEVDASLSDNFLNALAVDPAAAVSGGSNTTETGFVITYAGADALAQAEATLAWLEQRGSWVACAAILGVDPDEITITRLSDPIDESTKEISWYAGAPMTAPSAGSSAVATSTGSDDAATAWWVYAVSIGGGVCLLMLLAVGGMAISRHYRKRKAPVATAIPRSKSFFAPSPEPERTFHTVDTKESDRGDERRIACGASALALALAAAGAAEGGPGGVAATVDEGSDGVRTPQGGGDVQPEQFFGGSPPRYIAPPRPLSLAERTAGGEFDSTTSLESNLGPPAARTTAMTAAAAAATVARAARSSAVGPPPLPPRVSVAPAPAGYDSVEPSPTEPSNPAPAAPHDDGAAVRAEAAAAMAAAIAAGVASAPMSPSRASMRSVSFQPGAYDTHDPRNFETRRDFDTRASSRAFSLMSVTSDGNGGGGGFGPVSPSTRGFQTNRTGNPWSSVGSVVSDSPSHAGGRRVPGSPLESVASEWQRAWMDGRELNRRYNGGGDRTPTRGNAERERHRRLAEEAAAAEKEGQEEEERAAGGASGAPWR